MKFRSLYKFNNLENRNNFIFLAQLLEEMLFDYTLDTYKPSILNTHSLIEEAFDVINEVENGNINTQNISHVLKELSNCLDKDIIANQMITFPKNEIKETLNNKNKHDNIGLIKNTLGILEAALKPKEYKENLEKEIIKSISSHEDNFKEIRSLTRNYITFLLSNGYNQSYIRRNMLKFFFEGENQFTSTSELDEFFKIFHFNYKDYEVFFVADSIISVYNLEEEQGESFIKLIDKNELPSVISDQNFIRKLNNESFYSIKCKELDPFSARENVENTLRTFSNLINVFHHKKDIRWQRKFILIEKDIPDSAITVNESIRSMHKCIDLKEKKAMIQLQAFLKSFYLESESFNKFINSVRLHSMAIHTNSSETQLLNLWVSLESLIPEDTKSNKDSNIEHILKSIIPFLNMFYFKSLVEKLYKDLIRWNANIVRTHLRQVEGDVLFERLINLLVMEEYSDKLNRLISSTRDFYLLNDRIKYFNCLFSSKKTMYETIENHTKRLEWQIRRIYRARNIIVHTGVTPKYTPILIEHTHNYLDILLSTLIKLSSLRKISSVGQGFQYMSLVYSDYINFIQKKDNKLTKDELNKIFKYMG